MVLLTCHTSGNAWSLLEHERRMYCNSIRSQQRQILRCVMLRMYLLFYVLSRKYNDILSFSCLLLCLNHWVCWIGVTTSERQCSHNSKTNIVKDSGYNLYAILILTIWIEREMNWLVVWKRKMERCKLRIPRRTLSTLNKQISIRHEVFMWTRWFSRVPLYSECDSRVLQGSFEVFKETLTLQFILQTKLFFVFCSFLLLISFFSSGISFFLKLSTY